MAQKQLLSPFGFWSTPSVSSRVTPCSAALRNHTWWAWGGTGDARDGTPVSHVQGSALPTVLSPRPLERSLERSGKGRSGSCGKWPHPVPAPLLSVLQVLPGGRGSALCRPARPALPPLASPAPWLWMPPPGRPCPRPRRCAVQVGAQPEASAAGEPYSPAPQLAHRALCTPVEPAEGPGTPVAPQGGPPETLRSPGTVSRSGITRGWGTCLETETDRDLWQVAGTWNKMGAPRRFGRTQWTPLGVRRGLRAETAASTTTWPW